MKEENFDLMTLLTRVEWLLHRYHQQNHMNFGPMGDPRRGQGRILAILKLQPEISQRELSYLLDMRPQSLGELLAKLERNGYITRTPSETDRRVQNIKLTKEGTEATEAESQEFGFDKLFDCLNEEEQKNLGVYLSRIIETLEAQLGDEQPEADFGPHRHGDQPFGGRCGRHADWQAGKDHPGLGHHDPRLAMGRNNHRNRSFGHDAEGRGFGPRHGMGRGRGEGPGQAQDKPEEK